MKCVRISLKTKLSLSYVAVVLLCISLISIFANISFEEHFKEYVIQNQEQRYKEIIASISRQYEEQNKSWRQEGIKNIGMSALEQGLIIRVENIDEQVVWDARTYNNGECEQIIANISKRMSEYYPNLEGKYIEKKFPILHDEIEVGYVEIGHYGPFYFSEHDIMFINDLNKVFMSIGIFSMFFAFVCGVVMSDRLTKPISRVIETARMISKGNFGGRSYEKSSTTEITQLTSTINDLAATLERQENLRMRLTEDVAHELRTPLATVQSHMEAMIDGIWKLDIERLKSCHDEIIRLNGLVGDLERLAEFESENLILNNTAFDITSLVERIVRNFENDFMQKGIEIKFKGESETIFADKDKISQVIVNLLSNALKYTPAGGKAYIHILGNKENIELQVKDTGVGISEENLPYIFERFYRVEKSRNRLTGGAGIGLTITKAIVEAHKGMIRVSSELGRGTEFIVTIPKSRQS
ncbi:sensor histidine kinase [Anaerosolibacter carboniphilus]|uniref:sensor histidine kinase n=1 Tax=Anaerosolibacter carboniphilus TaxID=1417629 RepID=UPI002ED67305